MSVISHKELMMEQHKDKHSNSQMNSAAKIVLWFMAIAFIMYGSLELTDYFKDGTETNWYLIAFLFGMGIIGPIIASTISDFTTDFSIEDSDGSSGGMSSSDGD